MQNSKSSRALIALAAAAGFALLPTMVMADDSSVSLGSNGYQSTTHTNEGDRDHNNYNSTYDRDHKDYDPKHHHGKKHHHKHYDNKGHDGHDDHH